MGAVFSFLMRFWHSEVQSCVRVKSAQGPEFESLWPSETLSGMEVNPFTERWGPQN